MTNLDHAAPFLPPVTPLQPAPSLAAALPYLPPSQPIMPIPEPEAFDAAAMVASQKGYTANPAYGAMPAGTADGKEAARKLREQANRKKKRGKTFGRLLLLVLLGGVGVGGYFAYTRYQESQETDLETVDPDAASTTDATGSTPAADSAGATPLGGVVDGLEAQDALNDTATPSAGGFLGAIEAAREVVGQINADPAVAPVQGPVPAVGELLASDVTPPVLQTVAQRLSDENGFERYIVDAVIFETANVGAFDQFVKVAAVQPTVESDAFAMLPGLVPGEIGLAVQRVDDQLARVVILTSDRSLAVDVTQ